LLKLTPIEAVMPNSLYIAALISSAIALPFDIDAII
jgi:hypothetical protein